MRYVTLSFLIFLSIPLFSQVDTSFIYRTGLPFGTLDLRIARSGTSHYYLEEGKTFSYREKDGRRTETYLDMTSWDSDPYQEGNLRLRDDSKDYFVMNYRLLRPMSYNENLDGGYPLVLMMHGRLERGNCADNTCYHSNRTYDANANNPPAPADQDHPLLNNDYNLNHGGRNYLEANLAANVLSPNDPSLPSHAFPGFVLFPQNLNGWDGESAQDAIRIIRLLLKKYNIDENRIYINGLSNGGRGAYEALKRAPWMFACGVLFSAADDANLVNERLESTIAHIPLWIFQGGTDPHPTPGQTEQYVRAIREKGGSVRYTLYPNLGHGTWNAAFNEPDFFTWMLKHKKNTIHAFAGAPVICRTQPDGLLLMTTPGYSVYEWQRDGMIIEGNDKSQLYVSDPGQYRVRYSSVREPGAEDWSEWSEVLNVSLREPPSATIDYTGTLLLPGLDDRNATELKSSTEHAYYYWYKDGKQINFAGNNDLSLKQATIGPDLGSGTYTLRVSDYDQCISDPSDKLLVVFNNEAPTSLSMPANLEATVLSASLVKITWIDNTDDEIGFEIWRRTNTDTSTWEFVTRTAADQSVFDDSGLRPGTSYEYRVRAVNTASRSNYGPDGGQLLVTTPDDLTKPSAPSNLQVEQSGFDALALRWEPANDDAGISHYRIRYNDEVLMSPTSDTTFIIHNIKINHNYRISVSAIDFAENVSEESNIVEIRTQMEGLYYEHSTGAWNSIREIDWSQPEFTGYVDRFTLAPKTQDDFFNFRFTGFLNITSAGIYQFRTSSNDGSMLTIDDSLLVDNDGIHDFATYISPIHLLTAGAHKVQVTFFDYFGEDTLVVEYKGPDSNNEWALLNEGVLVSEVRSDVEDDRQITLFPNPIDNDHFFLDFGSSPHSKMVITLVDPIGKVRQQDVFVIDRHVQKILLKEQLHSGVYLLRIESDERIIVKKLFIR